MVISSMRYTCASILTLALLSDAWLLSFCTMSRSCSPYSRSLEAMSFEAFDVLSVENDSGITSLGTSPYFSARSATPQKVPPSFSGCWKKNCTRRSSMGFLPVSMMPCSIRLAFSNWS